MIDKLDALMQNPAFLIAVLVLVLTYLSLQAVSAASIMRARKDDIAKVSNRDQKAMDELHQRVEELKKK
jgi:cell division protein FtsB